MQFFRKLTLVLASVILVFGVGLAQDEDASAVVAVPEVSAAVAAVEAESPVLLNLNPVAADKPETPKEPPAPVVI